MLKADVSLRDFLMQEVPREIQAVLNRGGVNDRDWDWLTQDINDNLKDFRPANVLARADEYLLYPKAAEVGQESLLVFRKAIAILSFIPGGVRLFGLHFTPAIEGFVEVDEHCIEPW